MIVVGTVQREAIEVKTCSFDCGFDTVLAGYKWGAEVRTRRATSGASDLQNIL